MCRWVCHPGRVDPLLRLVAQQGEIVDQAFAAGVHRAAVAEPLLEIHAFGTAGWQWPGGSPMASPPGLTARASARMTNANERFGEEGDEHHHLAQPDDQVFQDALVHAALLAGRQRWYHAPPPALRFATSYSQRSTTRLTFIYYAMRKMIVNKKNYAGRIFRCGYETRRGAGCCVVVTIYLASFKTLCPHSNKNFPNLLADIRPEQPAHEICLAIARRQCFAICRLPHRRPTWYHAAFHRNLPEGQAPLSMGQP